jgi:hypothetical protein
MLPAKNFTREELDFQTEIIEKKFLFVDDLSKKLKKFFSNSDHQDFEFERIELNNMFADY